MSLLYIHKLGIQSYSTVLEKMQMFTNTRDASTPDEIWLVEHFPVYTQGVAGKACHILNHNEIPVVKADRGGQITYHGPGQLVIYVMLDLARKNLGVRNLVSHLEQCVIKTLLHWNISAHTRAGSPGVFVEQAKIASIGLRVKKGCTYHGIALNVSMDLKPFNDINPCGYAQLKMTQMCEFSPDIQMSAVSDNLISHLLMEHA